MSSQYSAAYEDPELSASVGLLPAWRAKAACLGEDPELFFPVGTTGRALDQIERAKSICEGCSVSSQCLEWALTTNQDVGVWGGMGEDERRVIRRTGYYGPVK